MHPAFFQDLCPEHTSEPEAKSLWERSFPFMSGFSRGWFGGMRSFTWVLLGILWELGIYITGGLNYNPSLEVSQFDPGKKPSIKRKGIIFPTITEPFQGCSLAGNKTSGVATGNLKPWDVFYIDVFHLDICCMFKSRWRVQSFFQQVVVSIMFQMFTPNHWG